MESPPSFAADVRPLFRERDHRAMTAAAAQQHTQFLKDAAILGGLLLVVGAPGSPRRHTPAG